MEIKLIRTILFRDTNGNNLRLTLGKIEDMEAYNRFMGFGNNDDKGFRWQFVGPKIPMPIRSFEWFNGFPEEVMVPWVQSQGYKLVAVTSHVTGFVHVFKGDKTTAVDTDDAPKRNKVPASTGDPDIDSLYHKAFCDIIYELWTNNRKIDALRLYRYAHGGSLRDAKRNTEDIVATYTGT